MHSTGITRAVEIGLAALLVVGLLVGATVLAVPDLWPFRPSVALIGDSITAGSADALRGELRRSYHTEIAATPGYRADELLPAAQGLAAERPEQVVVNLGTNDVMQGWPLDQSEAAVRALVGLFGDARCVHLVTVNERIVNFSGSDVTARARAYNEMLARVAASRPGADLVDWTAAVDRYEASGQPDGPFTFDSIHPLDPGQRDLAQLYHRALDSCPVPSEGK